MDGAPGLSDQYHTASPRPVFIAFRIPISGLGLLFGLLPLAVGGLLLFDGNVTSILKEFGYVTSMIRAVAALAIVFLVPDARLAFIDIALVARGYAVITAAILLAVGGVVFELFVHGQ